MRRERKHPVVRPWSPGGEWRAFAELLTEMDVQPRDATDAVAAGVTHLLHSLGYCYARLRLRAKVTAPDTMPLEMPVRAQRAP